MIRCSNFACLSDIFCTISETRDLRVLTREESWCDSQGESEGARFGKYRIVNKLKGDPY